MLAPLAAAFFIGVGGYPTLFIVSAVVTVLPVRSVR